METSYGKQIGKAIRAVLDMHEDCIRLFHDLDKAFPEYRSVYGNIVTLNQSSSISRRQYVTEVLIRLYARPGGEEQILGLNICFHDGAKLEEPIFVAANTRYRTSARDAREKMAIGWDPWDAFLNWSPQRVYGTPVTIEHPSKRSPIEQVTVAAAPLYSITSLSAALELIGLVGRP